MSEGYFFGSHELSSVRSPIENREIPQEQKDVQEPAKASLKPLGIFFIIVAVICAIGGFINTAETSTEGIQQKYISNLKDIKFEAFKKFGRAGATDYQARKLADDACDPGIEEAESELEKLQGKRELRMIYFFVPAGLLGIVGLIYCAKR